MTTPLTTIADALIEFILSLLSDPEAAAEFEQDPDASLAYSGLSDICAADVRSVVPVVVDRPDVIQVMPPSVEVTPPTVIVKPQPYEPKQDLIREIANVVNHFKIDNRSTIVDQSVNQSIWAEGDVTQLFDQEAVIATGDNSVAAGQDADIDNSSTDIDAGDIAIGNTDTDVEVNDSFNDGSTNVDVDIDSEVDDSLNDQSKTVETDVDIDDSFNDHTETNVEQSTVATVTESAAYSDEPAAYSDEPADYSEPPTDYSDEGATEELPAEDFDDQP